MQEQTSNEAKPKSDFRRRVKIFVPIAAIVGIVIGVTVAILIFAKKSSRLVGTWVRKDDVWTYEFKEDGSGSYGLGFGTPISFSYEDQQDSIVITYKEDNKVTYKYHFEGDNLVIQDQLDQTEVYERKTQK